MQTVSDNMRKKLIAGAVISTVVFGTLMVTSCSNKKTINVSNSPSPNGEWVAVSTIDQYSGPGNSALITDVFLHRKKSPDRSTNIFTFEQTDLKNSAVYTKWIDDEHLVIFYKNGNVDFSAIKFAGISISEIEIKQ